jgi:hypothetical protein
MTDNRSSLGKGPDASLTNLDQKPSSLKRSKSMPPWFYCENGISVQDDKRIGGRSYTSEASELGYEKDMTAGDVIMHPNEESRRLNKNKLEIQEQHQYIQELANQLSRAKEVIREKDKILEYQKKSLKEKDNDIQEWSKLTLNLIKKMENSSNKSSEFISAIRTEGEQDKTLHQRLAELGEDGQKKLAEILFGTLKDNQAQIGSRKRAIEVINALGFAPKFLEMLDKQEVDNHELQLLMLQKIIKDR